MPTETEQKSDERIAAFIAKFELLPEPIQQMLEAQATAIRDREVQHAETVTQLRDQNKALIAENTGIREGNSRFRGEIEAISLKNAGLRREIATARAENAALREEREAFELFDTALEQLRAKRRTADAAMRASKRENAEAPAELASADAEPAVDRANPGAERDVAPADVEQPEAAETDPVEEPAVEAIFSLPSVLVARIDAAIEASRWRSRDEFARAAFCDAINAGLPAPDIGAPVRSAAGKMRAEGVRRGAPAQG